MVIPLAAAVAVSTAPVATAVIGAPQAPSAPSAPTASPSHPDRRSVFPLTITRTGGIAGFQDVLAVARDGRVTVTRRGQQQRCRLTPAAAERLKTAASLVPWARITPDRGQARFPDDMVIMAKTPAGGPVRLENPQVGAVGAVGAAGAAGAVGAAGKVFQALLTDLSGGPATSRMCKAA